jgi:hypothetical protein
MKDTELCIMEVHCLVRLTKGKGVNYESGNLCKGIF